MSGTLAQRRPVGLDPTQPSPGAQEQSVRSRYLAGAEERHTRSQDGLHVGKRLRGAGRRRCGTDLTAPVPMKAQVDQEFFFTRGKVAARTLRLGREVTGMDCSLTRNERSEVTAEWLLSPALSKRSGARGFENNPCRSTLPTPPLWGLAVGGATGYKTAISPLSLPDVQTPTCRRTSSKWRIRPSARVGKGRRNPHT